MLFSTLVTLLIVEVFLRFYYADILFSGSKARSLYYSVPNLEVVSKEAVHYVPNSHIRSVAVYYNQVEYDTRHQSNNFGFLSNKDYHKEKKDGVIFLGDSFTAGVGSSSPWLPKLDAKHKEVNLYSFGVTGTGQENFYRVYKNFQNDLNYSTVVIMPISDDIRRKMWYPSNENGWLYFCNSLDKKSRKCRRIARTIEYSIDSETLLLPEELYIVKGYKVLKNRYEKYKTSKINEAKKKERSRLRDTQKVAAKQKLDKKNIHQKVVMKPHHRHYDLDAIEKIKALADRNGKRVVFIHIPEKREVVSGKYRYDIAPQIKAMGIAYYPILKTHHFDLSMYHPHDGHPNDRGYAYLSSVIEEILQLNQK